MKRGLIAIICGLLWFGYGAPAAVRRLDGVAPQARKQRSVTDIRALPLSAQLRAEEARLLEGEEQAWSVLVASLLTEQERETAVLLAASAPVASAGPRRTVEPEVPDLVDAVVRRYGPTTSATPLTPSNDPWEALDRRSRARALTALVNGPGLDPERAAVLLGATLELIEIQARRAEIESELERL